MCIDQHFIKFWYTSFRRHPSFGKLIITKHDLFNQNLSHEIASEPSRIFANCNCNRGRVQCSASTRVDSILQLLEWWTGASVVWHSWRIFIIFGSRPYNKIKMYNIALTWRVTRETRYRGTYYIRAMQYPEPPKLRLQD